MYQPLNSPRKTICVGSFKVWSQVEETKPGNLLLELQPTLIKTLKSTMNSKKLSKLSFLQCMICRSKEETWVTAEGINNDWCITRSIVFPSSVHTTTTPCWFLSFWNNALLGKTVGSFDMCAVLKICNSGKALLGRHNTTCAHNVAFYDKNLGFSFNPLHNDLSCFRPLRGHLLGYYKFCTSFWTWV